MSPNVALPPPWALDALRSTQVGRLATRRGSGGATEAGADVVDLVPFVFAWLAGPGAFGRLVSAVDHKPKTRQRLQRFANIANNPNVTVLLDHYETDWTQLWWIRIRGVASELFGPIEQAEALDALAEKYDQYFERRPHGAVLSIDITEVRSWRA